MRLSEKIKKIKAENHITINENSKLGSLQEYHLDRDTFVKIVKETIGLERLDDAVYGGDILHTNEFTIFRHDGECYILHRDSGMLVNWYKHLGRTNTCSQSKRTIEDYYLFFSLLKEDLDALQGDT